MTHKFIPPLLGRVAGTNLSKAFAGVAALFAASCQALVVYQNYSAPKKPQEIAVLRDRGYRFWLVNDRKKAADELRLNPGDYMIGFVTASREGGAALCNLEPNKVYSFRVIEKQYLAKTGTYALVGQCYLDPQRKDSRPDL